MGSPLGPVLANIFVGYFESILFTNKENPLNYFRYVYDIFISYKTDYNRDDLFDQTYILNLSSLVSMELMALYLSLMS